MKKNAMKLIHANNVPKYCFDGSLMLNRNKQDEQECPVSAKHMLFWKGPGYPWPSLHGYAETSRIC